MARLSLLMTVLNAEDHVPESLRAPCSFVS